ncbi:MAG: toxin-antitoxin system HicB family antitoxin [Planctomycetaceae bacterium]|jgi:hypothetical protein|nr:toxin-antitoxin system HicB family antitoxin [Planctomycetaceae bacterium]
MPEELHQEVKYKAKELGMSVNGYINHVLVRVATNERLSELERKIADHEQRIIKIEKEK